MVVAAVKKKSKFDMVMDDFKAFAKNFIKIVDNEGNTIPFLLNKEQAEFVDTMQKFNIIAKSRQIGFSTMSLAICLYNAVKYPNTNYMIVSLSGESVTSLFEKLKFMNDNLNRDKYPFPKTMRDNRGELVLENGSRVQVAASDGKSIGRGSTFQYILISEMAFYGGDQTKVLTSLEQALAKNNTSRLVIETTANGTANYYYELFMKSWKGKTNYKAFFYGWTSDAYKEQFRFEHDTAEEWFKLNNKGQRLMAKDLTEEEQRIHSMGANLRMLMWRQWKLSSMQLIDFQTEYPSYPEEAFKTSGQNVFDQGKILERMENLLPPLSIDELKTEIPEALLKYVGRGLNIYHLPKRNVKYYGGSDVSSGSGGDSSSLSIIGADGVQTLAFANNKVSVYEFAEFLNVIGRYYNYAFLCVERNSFGLPVIERLRNDYQYMNLYKHKTFDVKGKKKFILGWLTTDKTKAIMISDYKESFEKGLILVEDKDTLQQMILFVEQNGKMGNVKGKNNHDDLVISHSLSVQAMKANKWFV